MCNLNCNVTGASFDIKNSLSIVKAELDKKTNTLMTKSQGILDRIKAVSDSASSNRLGKSSLHPKRNESKNTQSNNINNLGVQNKQVMPSNRKSSNQAENHSKLSQNATEFLIHG